MSLGAHVLGEAREQFRKLKALAEGALAQVDDVEFFALPEPSGETNSIALVVKHLAGNARSRWTDFLTSDGEKADRRRDGEFELGEGDSRAALMAAWEVGWEALARALSPLTEDDLLRTITIRGEPHTVLKAIDRQLTHYGYHVGQIVLLARLARGPDWRTLSVARGESEAFNAQLRDTFPCARKIASELAGSWLDTSQSPSFQNAYLSAWFLPFGMALVRRSLR